jgi:hypothetical protein
MGVVSDTVGVTAMSWGISSNKGVDVGAGEGVDVGSNVAVGEGVAVGAGSGVGGGWASGIRVGRRPEAASSANAAERTTVGARVAEANGCASVNASGSDVAKVPVGDGAVVPEPRAKLTASDNSRNRGQASWTTDVAARRNLLHGFCFSAMRWRVSNLLWLLTGPRQP